MIQTNVSEMQVTISTDGSCYPNPGPGGWAAIFRYKGHAKAIFGYEERSTNIRMEMTAVIEALEYLKAPCFVELYTDSEFTINGATKWLRSWRKRKFMTSGYGGQAPKPVANQDLWLRMELAIQRHKINWHWVKGHANHADNILCDSLALQSRVSRTKGEVILEQPQEQIAGVQRAISFKDI